MLNSRLIGMILITLIMLLLMWPGFGEVIMHPNGFLFAKEGDGLKNYFNLGYYLKYDNGLVFSGVNYPYGENLLYTDTHPVYALILNLLDDHIWSLGSNSVAIINLSILSGAIAGALVLFLILTHYELPWWYAVIVAVCIAFLSPQWDRIHGHLSLSYLFVIPMFWYLTLKYEGSSRKRNWWIIIALFALMAGGIHLYYLAIGSAFIIIYAILSWLAIRAGKSTATMRSCYMLALSVILPLLTILLLSSFTDTVIDRPKAPYGFYVYHATFESVFIPHYSSVSNFLGSIFHLSMNWEGRAFVGTPVLVFLLGLLSTIIFGRSKEFKDVILSLKPISNYGLAAFLVLLFSMCIPFEWGFRFIPELISPIKQFRALGRFSWVFFYVINVVAAIYFFRISKELVNHGLPYLSYAFLAFFIVSWTFDAGAFYTNHGPIGIYPNDKLENTDEEYLSRFSSADYSVSDFQAVMALPLVAIRTDKMTFDKNLNAHQEAMKCAFHTGLPMIQSSASRPSLSQTLSSIQLISSPMIRKVRLSEMDARPLLLLHSKGSQLSEGEENLLQKSEIFWEDQYVQLGVLPLSAFSDSIDEKRKLYDTLKSNPEIEKTVSVLCYPDCEGVVFKTFEDDGSDYAAFYGNKSIQSTSESLIVFDSNYLVLDNSSKEASFWVFIDPSYSGMPAYEYLVGADARQLISTGRIETRDIPEVYGLWVRVNILLQKGDHHRIVIHGRKATVDNLMIKSPGQGIFIRDNHQILFNNYHLQ